MAIGLGLGIHHQHEMHLHIGMDYQGGIIFWLNGSGGGLIAAPADDANVQWGCYGSALHADDTAIGTGTTNTNTILNACTTADIAADVCGDKSLSGYTDWFLPSKDELNQMYLNKTAIGGFASALYHSSSEYSVSHHWQQHFGSGAQTKTGYTRSATNIRLRAIRDF